MAGTSSSYTDRIARQFEQQFGRPADAADPEYASYVQTALPRMIADDRAAYERSKGRWRVADRVATVAALAPYAVVAAPAIGSALGIGGGTAATGAATTAGTAATGTAATAAGTTGMTAATKLGIGELVANTFSNLWGASKAAGASDRASQAQIEAANHAADLEYKAITEALNYQKEIDARDYRDWLNREARDRTDWEAAELRRQPRRALADSAVRTLADYIRVPGMQPAQEVPVQRWTDPQLAVRPPVNTTMPVGGGRTLYDLAQPVQEPTLLARFGRRPRTLADFAA